MFNPLSGPIRVHLHPTTEDQQRVEKASSQPQLLYVGSSPPPAALFNTFVQVVRAVQRHLDGCLGIGVLCLQHFYGFS